MTLRFAVLEVRPSGKEAIRTAQEQADGRSRWDGGLPQRTLLGEQPEGTAEPTGYWLSNLHRHHGRGGGWTGLRRRAILSQS
jgi:hypothetical protein